MTKARLFMAAMLSTAPVLPAMAAEVHIQASNPVIELTVNETVRSAPDAAQVTAGVQLRAKTASEATRLNAAQMERVIARLRQAGIRSEDIQTSNFSLNPQYQYRNDQTPLFLGYDANNQVTVTLRDMGKIGSTLDALIEAGANNVSGPSFLLENDTAARSLARKTAFEAARVQAMEYARLSGFGNVRLLSVTEGYTQLRPMPMLQAAEIRATAAAKTPIEPGQVGTDVTMTAKYEMTR